MRSSCMEERARRSLLRNSRGRPMGTCWEEMLHSVLDEAFPDAQVMKGCRSGWDCVRQALSVSGFVFV